MDWFPLYNSIRISLIATIITFFTGVFFSYYSVRLPKAVKGAMDCLLTLPLVLPPTVIGFFLLRLIGLNGPLGRLVYSIFGGKITMTWYASVVAAVIVTFPLMYRTARSAFESFDRDLIYAGKTLGLSDTFIFWKIIMPGCKEGILAGVVLSFARGLGEYGATSMVSGYTPGRTATISTTVYQLWREGQETLAYKWMFVNLIISLAVLIALNILEDRSKCDYAHNPPARR
ncbi:molybdenum transport system permease protein ModB [Clostridiales bacterium]|nr:molybdenum transport system permease protein ModB [Clostridiales bacterium]